MQVELEHQDQMEPQEQQSEVQDRELDSTVPMAV